MNELRRASIASFAQGELANAETTPYYFGKATEYLAAACNELGSFLANGDAGAAAHIVGWAEGAAAWAVAGAARAHGKSVDEVLPEVEAIILMDARDPPDPVPGPALVAHVVSAFGYLGSAAAQAARGDSADAADWGQRGAAVIIEVLEAFLDGARPLSSDA